jgi:rhomboid protease GluP
MRDFPATTTLLAINLAVFVAGLLPGLNVVERFVNRGPLTIGGEYWRLLTAGFLHEEFFHIAFNMWCLWSLARLSERLFGKWQTFGIYLLTGVGGSLLSIAYDPMRAELGASGAIFGIAGALLAGLKFGNLAISAAERRSIISSMVFFVVMNFALGTGALGFGFGARIDNMCHLGGFVTGLLMGLPLGAFARNHKLYQLATILVTVGVLFVAGRQLVQERGPQARVYRAVIEAQDYGSAIDSLKAYTNDNPSDDRALVILGDLYFRTNQPDQAIAAYERALKANPNSNAKARLDRLRGTASQER